MRLPSPYAASMACVACLALLASSWHTVMAHANTTTHSGSEGSATLPSETATTSTMAPMMGESMAPVPWRSQDASDGSSSRESSQVNDIQQRRAHMWSQDFEQDESRLFRPRSFANADARPLLAQTVCDAAPTIVSKTSGDRVNGVCPDVFTEVNFSCTCISRHRNDSEWEFHLKYRTSVPKEYATAVPDDEAIPITSFGGLFLPKGLLALRLIGEGEEAHKIDMLFRLARGRIGPMGNQDPVVGLAESDPSLKEVVISNLNLAKVDLRPGFVPSTVTKLVMKNCNLDKVKTDALTYMDDLQDLDLSGNSLSSVFADLTLEACSPSCALESLNISFNRFESIPTSITALNSLKRLHFQGNPMTNFTISPDVFSVIQKLEVFEFDPPTQAAACRGLWQDAHGSRLCVSDESAHEGSSGNSYLLYSIIAGSLVIIILLFIVAKHGGLRRQRTSLTSKDDVETMFDNTLSYADSNLTINHALMNDPIIVMHRIPYNDLRVAACLNKGGFGLVYSGIYNRKRVAIKKIRADRSGDIFQIEAFLKEICLMATLTHPRVVEFIGVAWDSIRNLCAVTELMERGDLREVLHSFKLRDCRLTWDNHKAKIALHVAEALEYLHSLEPKVIHRDLKSKNVLLNGNLDAKLSDFGISRERNFEETHMTAGIGTSFWIAPEVLLGRDYDERADIYSFGIVLCEIDTDDYPYWNAENPSAGGQLEQNAILRMVAAGQIRPAFTDDCPEPILELAYACLEANPKKRPTASEIVDALEQIMGTCDFEVGSAPVAELSD